CVCDSGRSHMPGNPEQCRLNAARCLKLAKRARRPEMRETFTALADTWTRLAAERESDEAILCAISELEFTEPYEPLPPAFKLILPKPSANKVQGTLPGHRSWRQTALNRITGRRRQPSSGCRDRGHHVPSPVPSQTACSRRRAAPHRRRYSS